MFFKNIKKSEITHEFYMLISILLLIHAPYSEISAEASTVPSSQNTLPLEHNNPLTTPDHLAPYIPISERFISELEAEEKILLDKHKEFYAKAKLISLLFLTTGIGLSWLSVPFSIAINFKKAGYFLWTEGQKNSTTTSTRIYQITQYGLIKYSLYTLMSYLLVLKLANYRSNLGLYKSFLIDPASQYQVAQNFLQLNYIQMELKQRLYKVGNYVGWRKI